MLYLSGVRPIKENVLSSVKAILGLADSSLNTLLNYAIDRAEIAIMTYTGWEMFDERYVSAWISLAISYFNNDKYKNETASGKQMKASQTQGSRSETYINTSTTNMNVDGLTDDVKAMLPLPRLKVF